MARVVCVHGIGKQLLGERQLHRDWVPALRDGLTRAGHTGKLHDEDIAVAFYGDLFRPHAEVLSPGDPPLRPADLAPGLETDLLIAWWSAAADSDPGVVPPDAMDTLARVPRSVQAGLLALLRSRFFAGLAMRALIADLRQTRSYLTDHDIRCAARARVEALVDDDTEVVVAHSLGSVVAYEALAAHPGHTVRAFVTLGSPLGLPRLVFDRLDPAPVAGRGTWPGGPDLAWTNIVDRGDAVASVKDLGPLFGPDLASMVVSNGSHAHDSTAYLSDAATGTAIARGLRGR
ncbi:GPI inositol-deacylase (plasmid) [Embleya sp. NBC_00888]|uniref:hypothetical protein n=1 Tax=Embleya sp. NBC_00888 TaxID=2975960 RepID=UPI002F910D26|nr:GPI inositol-deacylase [Embleya sp. NBC_00888]